MTHRSDWQQLLFRTARITLLPIGAAFLLHQLLGEPAGYPAVLVAPLAIAPYDHVGPLNFLGFTDLTAFLLLQLQFVLIVALLSWVSGGSHAIPARAVVGLGLLLGGSVANGVETLIRGATLDYLWIDIGNHQLLVANVADLAIAMGVLFLVSTVVAVYRTESTAR